MGENKTYPWTTWTGYDEPSIGYVSAIGHLINYWHFRRTDKTIEQVYLHGMTGSEKPQSEILRLTWSWISPPELQMPDAKKSPNDSTGRYNVFTYDHRQIAYIVPRTIASTSSVTSPKPWPGSAGFTFRNSEK